MTDNECTQVFEVELAYNRRRNKVKRRWSIRERGFDIFRMTVLAESDEVAVSNTIRRYGHGVRGLQYASVREVPEYEGTGGTH